MSFFDSLLKSKPKVTQVVIPEHVHLKKQPAPSIEEKVKASAKQVNAWFEVKGVFAPKGTILLLGKVKSGQIRKGMILKRGDKESRITEVSCKNKSMDQLLAGQEGDIALDKLSARIEIGDTLEFKHAQADTVSNEN